MGGELVFGSLSLDRVRLGCKSIGLVRMSFKRQSFGWAMLRLRNRVKQQRSALILKAKSI